MANQARNSLKGGEIANQVAAPAPKRGERKNNDKMTAVRKDGILKELVEKEEKSKNAWNSKFGFYNSAIKEFQDKLVELNFSKQPDISGNKIDEPSLTPKLPATSTGMIGWGTERTSSINIAGPLYVSPKSTLIPEGALERKLILGQKHIVLG